MKDIDIRRELYDSNFLKKYIHDKDSRIIEELGLCQGLARIDIAVINGSLIGYEIKSEYDNLNRLPTQQVIYSKILDYVYLVSSTSHLDHINDFIPKWWGIIEVKMKNEKYVLVQKRKAIKNKGQDPHSLVQLLWKNEAFAILESLGLAKGLKNKTRSVIWKKLADAISVSDLSDIVRTQIKLRENWRPSL